MAAVLVHIDLDGERPDASSMVALAAGRHVASSWGATLYAALIAQNVTEKRSPDATAQVVSAARVPGIEAIENELARAGADKIVVAMTDGPVVPLWASVGTAWQGIVDHLRPRLVLFGADSPSAPELAPRTGARIGARLLMRATAIGPSESATGSGDVELRDRDGGYARVDDSGATVALIGHAAPAPVGDDDVDLVVLAMPGGGDDRIEVSSTAPADISHASGAIVALGDDVASDASLVADARRLANLLGARLVVTPAAARALGRSIAEDAIVDRTTPLAPSLCVLVGNAHLDLAGATSVIRIGAPAHRSVDGALPGDAAQQLADLLARMERR